MIKNSYGGGSPFIHISRKNAARRINLLFCEGRQKRSSFVLLQ